MTSKVNFVEKQMFDEQEIPIFTKTFWILTFLDVSHAQKY